jgi:hypothetical protein
MGKPKRLRKAKMKRRKIYKNINEFIRVLSDELTKEIKLEDDRIYYGSTNNIKGELVLVDNQEPFILSWPNPVIKEFLKLNRMSVVC